MSANAGPDIVEDGIVFYYDTGNTVKSYIGEPTTNQFTNSNFTNGTTGWTFGSWDGGRYLYSVENVVGPFGEVVPALKITRTSSDTSYAHFHQGNGGKYSNGNTYTLSAYVKGAGTLGQYNQGGFTPLNYNPGQFITLSSTWQRVDYTLSSQTDSNYPYWAAENITQNVPMYFVFAQSELKTHPTQYTPSSRSVTQGLLDLTGTKTINLTDVSFNSSAQITFDGTNDSISGGPSTAYLPLPTHSLEAWVKSPGLGSGMSTSAIFGITYGLIVQVHSDGAVSYYAYTTDSGSQVLLFSTSTSGVNILDNKWHHVVCTRDATNVKIYIDGVLNVTASNGGSWTGTNVWSSMNMLIGNNPNNVYYYFNGSIDIAKIYNRALSASEVSTNYNALKTRFRI